MANRNILAAVRLSIAPAMIIALAGLMRLLPHPPNVAPIGGLALFSGAHLAGPLAIAIPLLAMLSSDVVLGFHNTMPYIYISFFLIILMGRFLKGRLYPGRLLGLSMSSSLLFFVISNFGVWASTGLYDKTLRGFLTAYFMGLPFLRNTIVGDLFYSFVFFYGFAFVATFMKTTRLSYLFDKKAH